MAGASQAGQPFPLRGWNGQGLLVLELESAGALPPQGGQRGRDWEKVPAADVASRREAISKIAVVNLNKCGGKATSVDSDLWAAAYRDRQFLVRQLRLYAPHIIIACGVGDIAKHILFDEHWSPWQKTSTTPPLYWLRPKALDTLLVWTSHPQARRPHSEMYREVVEGLRELNALPNGDAPR